MKIQTIILILNHRGVGAMEIVAMDMKLRGMYIARQLSFHGVSFRIEEVPLEEDIKQVYDDSVKLVSYFGILLSKCLTCLMDMWDSVTQACAYLVEETYLFLANLTN